MLSGLMDMDVKAPSGLTPTTWNPSDKSAGITLSGGNLVATNSNGTGIDGVRSVDSTTGKVYFEIVWTVYLVTAGGGAMQIGIGNSSAVLTTTLLGQTTAAGYRDDSLALYNFGPNAVGSMNTGLNDNIGVAVDVPNKKMWFRKNGGTWDVTGGDDPATNVGGLNFTGITGAIFAITNSNAFSYASTAKFDSASWTYIAPAGFGVLGH
jgi:hypothetical protein